MRRAGSSTRVQITLACDVCKARNYRTTKRRDQPAIELKKFCKNCGQHTPHRATK